MVHIRVNVTVDAVQDIAVLNTSELPLRPRGAGADGQRLDAVELCDCDRDPELWCGEGDYGA